MRTHRSNSPGIGDDCYVTRLGADLPVPLITSSRSETCAMRTAIGASISNLARRPDLCSTLTETPGEISSRSPGATSHTVFERDSPDVIWIS